jgi:lipopolysaccharide/colanic/teichoic acid biosynthesis glycosyltransferase
MATTVAEISVLDTEYAGTSPARPSVLRLRTRRPSTRTVITSNILQFYPAMPLGAVRERVSSIATAWGSDTTMRVLNVAVAAIGLLITAPLFLLIGLAIKLSSRGPVFYKQTRVGLDRRWNRAPTHQDVRLRDLGGRPFTMYKFRTMDIEAESDSKEVWAIPDDRRVTRIGRYLRITRLDELPQLLNVVLGDMNIVGPRPERPTIFAELRETIPNYHMRQRVMPGITGWAQVNQAYDTCVDDVRRKVEFDLEYLGSRSVMRDLSIMVRTIPIMLFCRLGW